MAKQIVIDHVFKVFGDDPQEALALVRQGLSKQEVLARTGQSIGVFDAHLSIEAGEIFVVMGLSGSGKSTLVRLLNLLIEPSAGRILVDGVDIAQLLDAHALPVLELARDLVQLLLELGPIPRLQRRSGHVGAVLGEAGP